MIKAFVFDLDGTLVQTEILKAHSYALAAMHLKSCHIKKQDVIEEYKKLVGVSREEVAKSLMKKFDLEKESAERISDYEAEEPWQAFVQLRLKFYFEFLSESRILKKVECPYTVALLKYARLKNFRTALATTSHFDEASEVLKVLGIKNLFDFIATRDLIKNSKPDPEIYNLVLSELNLSPSECIVIEDSVTGIQAALAAKMNCIAVTNEYTRETVNKSNLLDEKWIVNDLTKLDAIALEMIKVKP